MGRETRQRTKVLQQLHQVMSSGHDARLSAFLGRPKPVGEDKGTYRLLFRLLLDDDRWGLRPEVRFVSIDGTVRRPARGGLAGNLSRAVSTERERNALQFMQHGLRVRLPGFRGEFTFSYGAQAGYTFRLLRKSDIYPHNTFKNPIKRHERPFRFRLKVIAEENDRFGLCLMLADDAGTEVVIDESTRILTWDEVHIYAGGVLYEAANHVPSALIDRYLKGDPFSGLSFGGILQQLERLPPDLADGLARDLSGAVEPIIVRKYDACRLHLAENDRKGLEVEAAFIYGDEMIEVPAYPVVKTRLETHDGSLYRIERDHEKEERAFRMLRESGVVRGNGKLQIDAAPLPFLLTGTALLEARGIEVHGIDELEHFRIAREKPRISIAVQSDIDWFDLKLVLDYAGIEVHVQQVLDALNDDQDHVVLPDGRMAYLSDAVKEAVAFIGQAGKAGPEPDSIRLKRSQIAAVQDMVELADEKRFDDRFASLLDRLKAFDRIDRVAPADAFRTELRPYQQAGLDWLGFLREAGFGGILADDMGLGKTVQALALLQLARSQKKSANLIIAPTSLVYNWQREAGRFTPNLSVLNHTGAGRSADLKEIGGYDLVLTSYAVLRRDAGLLSRMDFEYVILDESQHIKNPASQTFQCVMSLKARNRLCLTGTPVENKTSDLWSQIHFVNPGLLGSLNGFRERFAGPIEKDGDRKSAERLRRLTYPFILRRKKDQVASDLPQKTEQIVYCELEDEQRAAYEKWRDYYRANLLDMVKAEGLDKSRMHVLQGLMRLRQICNHPRLIVPEFAGVSGKLEYLFETLEELREEGHKVLVFSQFVKMLAIIRETLDRQDIRYAYLDGKTKKRKEIVDAFQNDPEIRHFLISLRAGGTGLNLTAADYVIIVDPWWNPAVEWQAIDRTHRIGQDKNVFALKLITRNTVEEKILQLQEQKKALADDVIGTESGFVKQLTVEQIEELFSEQK